MDHRTPITRRSFLKVLGLGALSSVALASYAFAIEPLWRLVVTRYRISPPGWPPGLHLKIAVLADIHACNPWMSLRRIEETVARTNALDPDVILLLGDYSAGMSRFVTSQVHSSDWAPVLGELRAPLGRFAVLGTMTGGKTGKLKGAGRDPPSDKERLKKSVFPFWRTRRSA